MKTKHYDFGPFRLSEAEKVVRRGDRVIPLTPKAFDILQALVVANGQVLTKEDLLALVWPDTYVEEGNLTFNISVLRKALGAEGADAGIIQTVPRRGYRLAVEVAPAEERRGANSRLPWIWVVAAAILIATAAFLYSRSQAPRIQSVAILPLRAIGGGPAPEPLALGLADSIITKMAGLQNLVVRPTASIARYERGDSDPLAAGRALQVDAVLTGTIQRTPERVRVAAQLYSVADGHELWGDQFDATVRDLFGLEDAISERVAGALRVNLSPGERRTMVRRYTSDAEAHELYITGRYYRHRWTADGAIIARQYFEQAIRKDPNYALAYVGLADALGVSAHFGAMSPRAAHAQERPALEQAIQIDPRMAEAHAARGMDALGFDWDGATAERELEQAVHLSPNLAEVHSLLAAVLTALGKPSMPERQKALHLDPQSSLYRIGVGWAHFYARDYRQADLCYQDAISKDPGFAAAYWSRGESLEAQGRAAEAVAAFERSAVLTNRNPRALGGLGHALGLAGRRQEALAVAAELQAKARTMYVPAFFVGLVYLGMDDRDTAFHWLQKAVDERSDWLAFIHVHPMFDPVRTDPRYRAIEAQVGMWPK